MILLFLVMLCSYTSDHSRVTSSSHRNFKR